MSKAALGQTYTARGEAHGDREVISARRWGKPGLLGTRPETALPSAALNCTIRPLPRAAGQSEGVRSPGDSLTKNRRVSMELLQR